MLRSKMAVISTVLAIALLMSCGKKDVTGPTQEKGTLKFSTTVWNQYIAKAVKALSKTLTATSSPGDTNTCNLINLKSIMYKIEVSTGEIIEGKPDNLDWKTIYESSNEILHTELKISIDLPIGAYKSIKLTMSNRLSWICTLRGNTLEFPDLNSSQLIPEAKILNWFGKEGLFLLDANNFKLVQPKEKLGLFEIRSGKITNVTLRMNIKTLDWIDNDRDGKWSFGDRLDNWTTPEGIDTMVDFIIKYE
jgi:hypothetical protein